MHEIRANLLKSLPYMDHSIPTAKIIRRAHKAEALRFVRNLRSGCAILIHSNYKSRQEILGSFFQPAGTGSGRLADVMRMAAGSLKTMIKCDGDGNITAGSRTYCCNHLASCKRHYQSPRGPTAQGRNVRIRAGGVNGRNGSFLCAYSTYEASQNFSGVVPVHDHVITDQPFIVYSKTK